MTTPLTANKGASPMFKGAVRRTKGFAFPGRPFEAIIHEAQPRGIFIAPSTFDPPEDAAPFWTAAVPAVNGGAIWEVTAGQFETEATAIASGFRSMRRHGWRETREEAETDAAAEIVRRTAFRADGTPRHPKA